MLTYDVCPNIGYGVYGLYSVSKTAYVIHVG